MGVWNLHTPAFKWLKCHVFGKLRYVLDYFGITRKYMQQQNSCGQGGDIPRYLADRYLAPTGKLNLMVVPTPSSLSTSIFPPQAFTIW